MPDTTSIRVEQQNLVVSEIRFFEQMSMVGVFLFLERQKGLHLSSYVSLCFRLRGDARCRPMARYRRLQSLQPGVKLVVSLLFLFLASHGRLSHSYTARVLSNIHMYILYIYIIRSITYTIYSYTQSIPSSLGALGWGLTEPKVFQTDPKHFKFQKISSCRQHM